jgi:hypothetical protein
MYLLTGTFCSQTGAVWGIVLPMVTVSIALMIFLLSLFYMAAQLFKRPEYEAFTNLEIYQLGVSATILVLVLGFSCFASEISYAFAGGDPFDIGTQFLNYMVNDALVPSVTTLHSTMLFCQYYGSLSMRWGAGVWGTVVPTFGFFLAVDRAVSFLLMVIIPFTSSLVVQGMLLEVIRAVAIPFVLPAGVVLRVFPPTREAGTFLICAAIGFQVVYPFTYVMHNAVLRPIVKDHLDQYEDAQAASNAFQGASNIVKTITAGAFDPWKMFIHPIRTIALLILQAIFMPALSMTLTISFIKGLSKFMSQKL